VSAPKAVVAVPAPVAKAKVPHDGPFHPPGIVVEIVGIEMGDQGRSCGEVMAEDVVVRLCKVQIMVEGKEETAIAAIWMTDGIHLCRVGYVPRHMVKHAAGHDGAFA
jgi:hypothetical protein